MNFWKWLTRRRDDAAIRRAEALSVESPAERRISTESVDDVAADERVEERFGGE